MDPLVILILGPLAVLLLFALALAWRHPRQGTEILGSLAEEPDAEVRRKRRRRRSRSRRRTKVRKRL
jgi:hypothetical protein